MRESLSLNDCRYLTRKYSTQIGQSLFVSFYLLNVFTTIVDLADKYVGLFFVFKKYE